MRCIQVRTLDMVLQCDKDIRHNGPCAYKETISIHKLYTTQNEEIEVEVTWRVITNPLPNL